MQPPENASAAPTISAIDLFCGAGGLPFGLQMAGITVNGGIDIDPACQYPFETNVEAPFLERDVRTVRPRSSPQRRRRARAPGLRLVPAPGHTRGMQVVVGGDVTV